MSLRLDKYNDQSINKGNNWCNGMILSNITIQRGFKGDHLLMIPFFLTNVTIYLIYIQNYINVHGGI